MRASVLADPALVKLAGRFVWLDVDTEKPENAAFLEKFPIETWPTFLVVDPGTEKPVLKWLGTAEAAQIEKLLLDGERAVRGGAGESPEAVLARADRANAAGRAEEAAKGYREALGRGGPGWTRRPRVAESLVLSLQAAGDGEGCAAAARAEAPGLPRGQSFANVVSCGLSCALGAPDGSAWGPGAVAALEPLAREAVALRGVLADDRAGLYQGLVGARRAAGDDEGARKLAEAWWRFLAAEGRRARTPEVRAALDPWRVECALELGDPARALPALQASERDLPEDYNPPARVATLYRELGRFDEALAASGRALARVYGPRKVRVFEMRAQILEQKGDRAAARGALEEGIAYAATLPESQRPTRLVERMQARAGSAE